MQPKINLDTIKYLEGLMKLDISDQKRQQYLSELTAIIDHFEDIKTVNIDDAQDIMFLNKNKMRDDIDAKEEGVHRDIALKNANSTLGDYYKVLKVIK